MTVSQNQSKEKTMNTQNKKQPPLQTFKDGAVNIKLWKQDFEDKTFVNASIGRIYKDKTTGEFKETRSFNDTDLLKLQAMIPQARQELNRLQDYYREISHQKETTPSHASDAKSQQDLTTQRDAVIKAAHKPDTQHELKHESTLSKNKSR